MPEPDVISDSPPERARPFQLRTAEWLVRWRIPLLLLSVAITGVALPLSLKVDLDQSIESFFAPTDPLLQGYQESRAAFGGDEFVLVAYEKEDISSPNSLKEIAEFSKELSEIQGISRESTQDLASTLTASTASVLNVLPRLIRPSARRAIRERLIEFSEHLLIGGDDNVTAIILRLIPEKDSPVDRKQTYREIRKLAADHDPPAFVAGEPIQVNEMFRYVERDGRVLGLASTTLMVLAILIMFRRIRWVILPIVIVQMTLIWTKAILYLLGMQLSMVSSMLTSLLTIIGVATVVHVIVLFRDWRRDAEPEKAFCMTWFLAASPVFWVTITTVVGFAALLTSEITPIRSFAWMMSIGTTLLLVTFPMVLPGGVLLGKQEAPTQFSKFEQRIAGLLDGTTTFTNAHPWPTMIVTGVICVVAILGCLKQRVETDFSKNFRPGSEIVQSIRFFESKLGGVGSWEVNFKAPRELTTEFIGKVRQLTDDLRNVATADGTKLTKVISITDGLDLIPPIIADDWIVKRSWLNDLQPEFEPSLYSAEHERMRIVLRAQEQQPAERKLELISKVEQAAGNAFPEARTTGLYVLLANLISSVLGDQLTSAFWACVGMVACIWLAFRSFRIAMLSLVPNVLPILFVCGFVGWMDIPVNIGVAMVASVSLGLTIDASIMYLTEYLRIRKTGGTHDMAIHETHGGAALALVLASIALIAGFAVLTVSEFIPLAFFGAMVSVAMIGGLLGNLVLLPVMLRWLPADFMKKAPVETVDDVTTAELENSTP
ncbi:MMPL family protein [Caulifigura coniformis]|uniref:MMPL family protein n=1 Tax=Caulifigura coniformis TaxID=2527983 RepID=A0A517SMI2_9PLAN|nr:MMPL family protein [Caulifigura coniformis]